MGDGWSREGEPSARLRTTDHDGLIPSRKRAARMATPFEPGESGPYRAVYSLKPDRRGRVPEEAAAEVLPDFHDLERRMMPSALTVVTTADSGPGSLRDAIDQLNSSQEPNAIDFDIAASGVQTITLASPLPPITTPVTIGARPAGIRAGRPAVDRDRRHQHRHRERGRTG